MRLVWHDRDVDLDAGAVRDALREAGVVPGGRVAAVAGNTPLHVLLHVASRADGWTLVPLPATEPAAVLRARLARLRCATVVGVESPALREAAVGRTLLVGDPLGQKVGPASKSTALPAGARPPARPEAESAAWTMPPEDRGQAGRPRLVLETSGTGGAPRAVPITEEMLAAHASAAARRIGHTPSAVWGAALGLHHVGGAALLDRALRLGGTVALEARFDAGRLADVLRRHEATHVSLVPAMLARLLAAWGPGPPPGSLRCVLLGGDAAPAQLMRTALAAGWPVHTTYGLTEACSQVCTATPEEWLRHPGTSGLPLDGVQVGIEEGEIVVAGPTVAGGGPLRTGDLGVLEDGRLRVLGRKDDRITTGGAKVDPANVEAALAAHPDVQDAAVVGLPDSEWGQRVVAAVVLRPGAAMPDLRAWCKARLPPQEVPKELVARDALPRTEAGKLRRAAVRAMLQGHPA